MKHFAIFLAALAGLAFSAPEAHAARKLNVGHYTAMMRGNDDQRDMQRVLNVAPGTRGIMKRYSWKSLEPTQGAYNFSEVQSDLTLAAANGVQLIVMIEDKTFISENPSPNYLAKYSTHNKHGGYMMWRWHPTVKTRMDALVVALGKRFDAHHNFEGIALVETAPSLTSTELSRSGYSAVAYGDYYISIIKKFSAAAPTSRVFWFQNFIPGDQKQVGRVLSAVVGTGIVNGGPDVWPENRALVARSYPYYDQFKGKMPMFGQVEPICYSQVHSTTSSTTYWTMTELFNYAKNELHINYMIWVAMPRPKVSGGYDWYDAVPVYTAQPAPFNPAVY